MYRQIYLPLLIVLTALVPATAQVTGGRSAFEFLQLPVAPQLSALGGTNVSHPGQNVALAAQNPSLLRPYLHNQLAISYNDYYAGISLLNLHYAYHSPKWKTTFGGGIQYVNYGSFIRTDDLGNQYDDFKARDVAVSVSAARKYQERWHYGATLKYVGSRIDDQRASGLLADLGVTYIDTANNITFGFTATNMGTMLKAYENSTYGREPMPFDLRLGISKRFKYLPLRLMATVHHLNEWDIRYNNPDDISNTNILGVDDSTSNEKSYFADKLFRHFIFAAEITLAKRLAITAGYNHLRRGELGIRERNGLAGFSFGASLYLNKLQVHYARSYYHPSGAYNEFGFNFQLNKLMGIGKGLTRENWRADYTDWD